MKVVSVIVAAGKGARYGRKKQFDKVFEGRIVLDYSVEKLSRYGEVVIVTSKEDMEFVRSRYNVKVIEGGEKRKYSVLNGLKSIRNCDVVLVHDAARPVLVGLDIDGLIKAAKDFGAAILYCSITETVKLKEGDFAIRTLDRNKLVISQTPQAFQFGKLLKLMEKYVDEDDFTDEAAIWEKFYGKVRLIEGSRKNIKITENEDLELVRCLLG